MALAEGYQVVEALGADGHPALRDCVGAGAWIGVRTLLMPRHEVRRPRSAPQTRSPP
jgi:hypothetical protein